VVEVKHVTEEQRSPGAF